MAGPIVTEDTSRTLHRKLEAHIQKWIDAYQVFVEVGVFADECFQISYMSSLRSGCSFPIAEDHGGWQPGTERKRLVPNR